MKAKVQTVADVQRTSIRNAERAGMQYVDYVIYMRPTQAQQNIRGYRALNAYVRYMTLPENLV